ncbi:hypothetical protein [Gordonia tangerina]|uniref:Uncharacterized protein n=1 Tax=Gordonia tangerina TaxID=2911060 RepID=A0ABS9DR89_9ACTN|nr:hypothetical protein [Gordonia tangerina]MCF3940695.1 hypothetical protein [Gordonia tangerina]
MVSTFTIDGFEAEHVWTAVSYGRPWNGWATPVVTREVLESVIAAAEGETLAFVENVAVITGDKLKPDINGHYDLGQIGWCFVQTDHWAQ